ncbi:MAG: M48 family metallopeptidase [Phenylobacterium sp.]|uniref:M48 family metalloprotease n=1 Tax=Phenylobacterium sp. TaxID=1871053 RepID=UPI0025F63BCD|nr:M48 family metalloprotease [Phenylobacterium sp.]MCA6256718.1 M48 family metallopeptidase [Phenylobacterium sp.]MCA6264556.1 M48 family metallopeptidase [Phenylobacterium sp.]MCA6265458.1 M48 family metallopeptidase [Phenylobacterium sp.]MCA6270873.1 M48 family metallopeptidase [Phenylobacterium sp.]MCA6301544.1 M48 family metallopeptidase [Phenylobacterium sp.]
MGGRRLAHLRKGVATGLCLLAALVPALSPAPARAQSAPMTLIRDTEIEETLRLYSQPLFTAAGVESNSIRILLIGSKDLNAFAGPGVMAVFTGLILETQSPNELQGVIAHEVAHLAGGHSARSGEMSQAGLRPFLLTMGLGVLAALAGNVEAGAVLASNAGFFGTLGAMGYSREQESRADQAGASYLEAAGLSGRGLVNFFDNFRYQEVFAEARRFGYFRSHPLSSSRIDALRARVEGLSNYNTPDDPENVRRHEIMKAKLQGFLNPGVAIVKCADPKADYPARYACAIAQYQLKEPDRALKLIDALLLEQPDNPYLWELKGQILFEFGRTAEAEAPQRRSVALKPDAPLLRVNLGQTLIALTNEAKIDEGIRELKTALDQDVENSVAWRLLSQAYDARGRNGLARYATAEYNYIEGDRRQALIFALRARDLLERNTPEWRRANDIVLATENDRQVRNVRGGD